MAALLVLELEKPPVPGAACTCGGRPSRACMSCQDTRPPPGQVTQQLAAWTLPWCDRSGLQKAASHGAVSCQLRPTPHVPRREPPSFCLSPRPQSICLKVVELGNELLTLILSSPASPAWQIGFINLSSGVFNLVSVICFYVASVFTERDL